MFVIFIRVIAWRFIHIHLKNKNKNEKNNTITAYTITLTPSSGNRIFIKFLRSVMLTFRKVSEN